MHNLTVLLIIASSGYQPIEYGHTRKALQESGITVVVASNKIGTANAQPSESHSKGCSDKACSQVVQKYPEYSTAKVDILLDKVDANLYDGIFIIGGPRAMEYLDNPITYKIIKQISITKKPFGAICISPRILANAGVLVNINATGWDGDNKLEAIFKNSHTNYIRKPVVVDGNIITANGPDAATEFGEAIVNKLHEKN